MKAKFFPFNTEADRVIGDPSKRSEILAAAIGRAIANAQQLPSSPVESPASFFNAQALPQVRAIVSEWNENIVFNTKSAIEFARMFWNLRYAAAHPNSRPTYNGPYGFFDTISGVSSFVSDNQYTFLLEQQVAVLALSTSASYLIAEAGEASNG